MTKFIQIIIFIFLTTAFAQNFQNAQQPAESGEDMNDLFGGGQEQAQVNAAYNEQQQQYLNQFSQTMGDFNPTQTFNFNITQSEQIDFLIWIDNNVTEFRGIFYLFEGLEDIGQDLGLYLSVYLNNNLVKNFQNRKLGLFKTAVNSGDEVKLKVKSDNLRLGIYMSYQAKVLQKSNKKQQNKEINQTEMQKIYNKFQKTQLQIGAQENLLHQFLKMSNAHYTKVDQEIQIIKYRMVLQTLAVIISATACLYLLKKNLKSGYQSLI